VRRKALPLEAIKRVVCDRKMDKRRLLRTERNEAVSRFNPTRFKTSIAKLRPDKPDLSELKILIAKTRARVAVDARAVRDNAAEGASRAT